MTRPRSFAYSGALLLLTAVFGCTDESSGVTPLMNDGDAGPPPESSNSGEEADRICDPGATQACAGSAGCTGGQTCSADGQRWSACDCGEPTGAGGEGAGGDSNGVGGEGPDGSGGTTENGGGTAATTDTSEGGTSGSSDPMSGGSGGLGSGGAGAAGGSGAVGGSGGNAGGTAGSGGSGGEPIGGTSGDAGSGAGGTASGGTASGGAGGVAGSGGTGGAASGGTGGFGGTLGSAGAGGQLNCVPGAGLELIPEPGTEANSGWVSGDNNCVGIEGTIFGYTDELGSTISIVESDGRVCVEGEATAILNGNFLDYWGSVVAFELNHVAGDALAYDADAYGVTGFALQISGSNVPEGLRVRYRDVSDEEFCIAVSGAGSYSVALDATHPECWEPGDTSTPDPGEITRLEVHVVSEAGDDIPFDFCIDNITAIQSEDGGEGGAGGGGAGGEGGGAGGGGAGGEGGNGGETSGSCSGNCGDFAPEGCACDSLCEEAGDCCEDYTSVCGQEGESCADNCGAFLNDCACDELCEEAGDCCPDYVTECTF